MKEKIGVAVLVSGGGTNLQALIDAAAAGRMPACELRAVISSREDAYALVRAREAGIRAEVVSRREHPGQADFEGRIRAILDSCGAEVIVLAGFLSILSEDFTRAYPERILNVHPSLIPAFCGKGYYGLRVHEEAIARGVKITGATVHFVNEVPDGGRIILQKAVRVKRNDTPETLQKRVMREAEWKLLPAATQTVCAELLRRRKKEGTK